MRPGPEAALKREAWPPWGGHGPLGTVLGTTHPVGQVLVMGISSFPGKKTATLRGHATRPGPMAS